jgi:hypothetical protein
MNKIITISLMMACLGGCATGAQYGDFTAEIEENLAQDVMNDAVNFLADTYPVGKVVFKFDAETAHKSGKFLETNLRNAGFGVSYQEGIPLNYIFDDYSEEKKRLTLVVGNIRFSRVYMEDTSQNTLMKSQWTVVE